eukprot:m.574207 g.574207  ORF g.574207 m.574207 type:complete len:79 (-) comp57883_c0_seq41:3-239(-)
MTYLSFSSNELSAGGALEEQLAAVSLAEAQREHDVEGSLAEHTGAQPETPHSQSEQQPSSLAPVMNLGLTEQDFELPE